MKKLMISTVLAAAVLSAQPGRGPFQPPPAATLTAEEAKTVTWMREEEKLARDVYKRLGAKWELTVFARIAESEQRRFEALGRVLERYGVADPAAGKPEGAFSNPDLATLYQQLVTKGEASMKDALEVGVMIEQLDIKDLEEAIAGTTKTDLKTVYTNLMTGSLSHLEAFEGCLEVCVAAQ